MLSQANETLLILYKKGYRINASGVIIGPKLNYPKGSVNSSGYLEISLKVDNRIRKVTVHRLQAYQKFGNKIFMEGIEVRHKNGNQLDNSYDNILIGSHGANMMDRPQELRQDLADEAAKARRRFSNETIAAMRLMRKNGATLADIGMEYGLGKGHVSDIVNGKLYQ